MYGSECSRLTTRSTKIHLQSTATIYWNVSKTEGICQTIRTLAEAARPLTDALEWGQTPYIMPHTKTPAMTAYPPTSISLLAFPPYSMPAFTKRTWCSAADFASRGSAAVLYFERGQTQYIMPKLWTLAATVSTPLLPPLLHTWHQEEEQLRWLLHHLPLEDAVPVSTDRLPEAGPDSNRQLQIVLLAFFAAGHRKVLHTITELVSPGLFDAGSLAH
jgi:hypothetical protein